MICVMLPFAARMVLFRVFAIRAFIGTFAALAHFQTHFMSLSIITKKKLHTREKWAKVRKSTTVFFFTFSQRTNPQKKSAALHYQSHCIFFSKFPFDKTFFFWYDVLRATSTTKSGKLVSGWTYVGDVDVVVVVIFLWMLPSLTVRIVLLSPI